jgi:glycosyltransferase involved in cell wall biosynthesis
VDLRNSLEIILLTYNRKEKLQKTFNQIFADNSPIKNLDITILDNKSTDGTSELIREYTKKFPNIKHIIHNRNIGGNANIARAFEIAQKEYFWILCDDDEYNWDNWSEVEHAIKEDYDAIVVANYADPKKDLGHFVAQLTFVPSTIYKTKNITDTVMANAEFNLSNMFAQLALPCHLINEEKPFYICNNWCVKMIPCGGEETYTRGMAGDIHPLMKNMYWPLGFTNSVQMIQDKKTRETILSQYRLYPANLFSNYWDIYDINRRCANATMRGLVDIYLGLNFKQKSFFILIGLIYLISALTIRLSYSEDKLRIIFCSLLKTDIKIRQAIKVKG